MDLHINCSESEELPMRYAIKRECSKEGGAFVQNIKVEIIEIYWLSKEANEADVLFKIKNKTYHAFGCHVYFEEGKEYDVAFDFLEGFDIAYDVMFSENADEIKDLVPKNGLGWEYSAYGKVISLNPVVVDCGFTTLDIGYKFREESLIDKYIFFDIARLDIMQKSQKKENID